MHVIGSLKRVNQGNCRENPLDGLELEGFWWLTNVERQELLSGKTQSHRSAIAALLKFYLFVTYGLHACKAAYLLLYRELSEVGNVQAIQRLETHRQVCELLDQQDCTVVHQSSHPALAEKHVYAKHKACAEDRRQDEACPKAAQACSPCRQSLASGKCSFK